MATGLRTMALASRWTSKNASPRSPRARRTSAGRVSLPVGFMATMLRTRLGVYRPSGQAPLCRLADYDVGRRDANLAGGPAGAVRRDDSQPTGQLPPRGTGRKKSRF